MGVAVPLNKLIQQTIQYEGWLSWLGLGRGGHTGGTCNCSNCTAKEVKQRAREANPPTFQTHFGFDEGLKNRTSDKESQKKTQTRMERQLPYIRGPGESPLERTALHGGSRSDHSARLLSGRRRVPAQAPSWHGLLPHGRCKNQKKHSTSGNGASGSPKTCDRCSLPCRSTPASNEVAMTTRNGSFPNATPSANGLFRRRFPDQKPGEWQFRGFCFLTLPPPIGP